MQKRHTLTFEDDDAYDLICIHTSLEDYRLAFYINQVLNFKLFRREEDLDFENNKGEFSLYEYDNPSDFVTYNLIANKNLIVTPQTEPKHALFYNTLQSDTTIAYLLNDKKRVDFFLKISGGLSLLEIEHIIEQLNSIPQVLTTYITDPKKLKQKEHLIF